MDEARGKDFESRHFERVLDAMGDGLYVLDEEGRFASVNDYLLELGGYDREEILSTEPAEYLLDEDVAAFEEAIVDLLQDEETTVRTVRATLLTAEGEEVPIEVKLTLRTDEEGAFRGTIGVVRDVTERRARERELERYETIVRTIPDVVAVIDNDGRQVMINNIGRTGYTREELLGEHFSMTTPAEDAEKAEALAEELYLDDDLEKATYEQDLVTKDGEHVPHETHLALLPEDDDGMIPGVVAVLRDISERVERERRLHRQNERLEEFASVVSHDLRNPLNIAQGTLQVLAEDCESDAVETIERAQARMEEIIQDTLTLARQGQSVGETERVVLSELAGECWASVETSAATLEVDDGLAVVGDPGRLRHLFENLFRNAVEHGGSDVAIRVGGLDDGFYVEDDGPGIPEDERQDVLEAGYSGSETGTGFGLTIVRRISEAHDWELHLAESAAGGARFEFTGVEPA